MHHPIQRGQAGRQVLIHCRNIPALRKKNATQWGFFLRVGLAREKQADELARGEQSENGQRLCERPEFFAGVPHRVCDRWARREQHGEGARTTGRQNEAPVTIF